MIHKRSRKPGWRTAWASLVAAWGAGCLAGCAIQRVPPAPLDPVATAASLSGRSLRDQDLHRFLVQNLGREPGAWDFETLTWVSFYYQPSLEVARAQWDVARGAQRTASARPNPTIGVTPGYNSSAAAGVSPWFPAVNLDFLLETNAKRDRRSEIERRNAESARLNAVSAAWLARGELRKALIESAAAERRQTILRDQVGIQQQLETLLQQRLSAGAISSSDLAPTHAARLRAEVAADDAERQMMAARGRVARALGIPLAALDGVRLPERANGQNAAPAPGAPEWEDLFFAPGTTPARALVGTALTAARSKSLQSRSDILAALARYQASESSLALEVAKQFPDFHVGPGYQWDQGENKWSLAVSLELPVFNRNQGPIAEAEGRRRQAAAEFVAAQAGAIAAIDSAAAQALTASARVSRLQTITTDAQQQAVLAERRVSGGGGSQADRQNALLEVNAAELALLDARVDAATAAGDLEDALQINLVNLENVLTSKSSLSPPSP